MIRLDEAQKDSAAILIREHMTNRVDIAPIISEIEAGTHQLSVHEKVFSWRGVNGRSPEAMQVWDSLKAERNAFTAVFIGDIYRSFETLRNALLTTDIGQEPTSLLILKNLTDGLFQDALQSWHAERESRIHARKKLWDPRDRAYNDFRKILAFGRRNYILNPHEDTPDFISRGITTASRAIWGTIGVVPEIAKKVKIQLPKSEIIRIIKASYGPVIVPFASMNISIAVPLLRRMMSMVDYQFAPQYFSLTMTPSGYSLSIDHGKLLDICDEFGIPILQKTPPSDTTGCPAKFANDGKGNVLKGMFDWSVALAENYLDI